MCWNNSEQLWADSECIYSYQAHEIRPRHTPSPQESRMHKEYYKVYILQSIPHTGCARHNTLKILSSTWPVVFQSYKISDWQVHRQNCFKRKIFFSFSKRWHWQNLSESLKTYQLWPQMNGLVIGWLRVGTLPFYSIQFSTIAFNKIYCFCDYENFTFLQMSQAL